MEDLNIKVNDEFVGMYPPESAEFCNMSGGKYELIIDRYENDVEIWKIVNSKPPSEEEIFKQIKSERTELLNDLTVEIDGLVFDADIDSQYRMGAKVLAYTNAGLPVTSKVKWVMADNTVAEVTIQQLAEAHFKASQKTEEIWISPYNN